MFSQTSEGLHGKTSVYVVRLFYHEAKMFVRKDIFARPSIAQTVQSTGGKAAKFCAVKLYALIISS